MSNITEIFASFDQIIKEEIINKNYLLISPKNRYKIDALFKNNPLNYIDEHTLAKLIVNVETPMPLEILWYFQKRELLYLGSYIYFHPDQAKKIPQLLVQLACIANNKNSDKQIRGYNTNAKQMLTDFLIELLISCEGSQVGNTGSNFQSEWTKTSLIIWQSVRRQFLSMLLNRIEEFNINYLKDIRETNDLTDGMIMKIYRDHLQLIVKHKPYIKVQMAIQHQRSWTKANLEEATLNIFTEIISFIPNPLEELINIMKEEEISWKWCLIAVSICLNVDANINKFAKTIDDFISRAFGKNDADLLLIGFLLARQASYENLSGFDSYQIWYSKKFGIDSNGPSSKDKTSFEFLIKFLTSIIPYETEDILKIHLEKSFGAPSGCMSLIKDYKSLLRTRLLDLSQDDSQYE